MNTALDAPRTKLVILERSGAWTSWLRNELPNVMVVRALTADHLWDEAAQAFASIAILEMDVRAKDFDRKSEFVFKNQNDASQTLFLAIGDEELSLYVRELAETGFAATFSGIYSRQRLAKTVRKHWNSISWPSTSIEDDVEKRMPWPNRNSIN